MSHKVSRRSFLKKTLGATIAISSLCGGGYTYARRIEPSFLKINHIPITHKEIPQQFHQLKMVHFSDTHIGFQYTLEQLSELVNKINSLKPDIIFFTGDLLDAPNDYDANNELVSILRRLDAPYGKYAVYGNHDHGGYGTDIYRQIVEEAGFMLLLNDSIEIVGANNESIYVIGIDDAMLGKPNFDKALQHVPSNTYRILLSHAPDLADMAAQYHIQLQLSGHSHGGQIKIPFVGALVKPPFGEKYFEGLYEIGNEKKLTLYVNRGLGTTRLPFRFLSTPELTVYTLEKKLE